ncbi:helix-turn-helix domain-containing protein [Bosea sp. (in: a-proteobacteria)]|uniref:helix-turn-helix domain-containing protein n=1 Tax=Bosea sp. (in: a-proteobacteria) TaxID=1871050 RepID=UPI0026129241|nr:helix-turn-helix domain-containing protein [Bosea sp. (in: a-proteobacteria)]MCO5092644.1 hypothetical protein [Bosea sp. (in: a-proteobacteria)]
MSLVPTKEYTSAAEIYAARRALRAQFYAKPVPKPAKAPEPIIVAPSEPEPDPREKYLRDWLSLASPGSRRASCTTSVLEVVAKHTGFDRVAIIGESRRAPLVRARQMAYWLLRKHTTMSFPHIGSKLGGRDHTTILSGFNKIEFLMAEDRDFAALMGVLSAEIASKAQEGRSR